MITKIHLVRHGEVHNPQKIFYGRLPGYFLSELGIHEVHRLGKHLQKKSISHIYSSPLERTKQSSKILSDYFSGITTTYDERLIEVGSPLEGLPFHAVDGLNFYNTEYIEQGGETIEDIRNRMKSFFNEVNSHHTDEDILVVSHGDPIMITKLYFQKKEITVADLRGGMYIPTAHGIEITVNDGAITVSELTPIDMV